MARGKSARNSGHGRHAGVFSIAIKLNGGWLRRWQRRWAKFSLFNRRPKAARAICSAVGKTAQWWRQTRRTLQWAYVDTLEPRPLLSQTPWPADLVLDDDISIGPSEDIITTGTFDANGHTITVEFGGTFTIGDGGCNLNGAIVNAGTLNIAAGLQIWEQGSIQNSGTLNIQSGGWLDVLDGEFLSDQPITLAGGGGMDIENGNVQLNGVNAQSGSHIVLFGGSAGTSCLGDVVNHGSIIELDNSFTANINNQEGTLELAGTDLSHQTITNSGTITLGTDGIGWGQNTTIAFYDSTLYNTSTGVINPRGQLIIGDGSTLWLDGTLGSAGELVAASGGSIYMQDDNELQSGLLLTIDGGTFELAGHRLNITATAQLTVKNGGVVDLQGGVLQSTGVVSIASGSSILANGMVDGEDQVVCGVMNSTSGEVTNNGTITVSQGSARFGPLSGDGALIVGGFHPGSITFSANAHLGILDIQAGGTAAVAARANSVLQVHALSINTSNGGKLDLGTHAMVLETGSLSTIEGWIQSGRNAYSGANFGRWDGVGIQSTYLAKLSLAGFESLVIGSAQVGLMSTPPTTQWGISVGSSTILVACVRIGDTDLDGQLTEEDLFSLTGASGSPVAPHWFSGDLNYDGSVNAQDQAAVSHSSFFAPANVSATVVSATNIALNWEGNLADPVTGFLIQRKGLNSSDWKTIAAVSTSTTSWHDTWNAEDAPPQNTYLYYRVAAVLGADSEFSDPVFATFGPLASALSLSSNPPKVGVPMKFSVAADPNYSFVWEIRNGSAPALPNQDSPRFSWTPTADDAGTWTVQVTITNAIGLSTIIGPQTFTIAEPPPAQILGPTTSPKGVMIRYEALGITHNLHWIVKQGDTTVSDVFTVGDFFFTPQQSGNYVAHVTGDNPGDSATKSAALNLTVAYVLPEVTISGDASGYFGQSRMFGSHVQQQLGVNEALSYAWKILDYEVPPEDVDDIPSDLSTFAVPGKFLATGSYKVQLTVNVTHEGTTIPIVRTFDFSVLANPASPDPRPAQFDWGFATDVTHNGGTPSITQAMARQEDGKIVIAGVALSPGRVNLYRFNADLTPDTTFGPDGNGKVEVVGLDSVRAIAFNPVTKDLVVAGQRGGRTGTSDNRPIIAVQAIRSQSSFAEDGTFIPAGAPDPDFNSITVNGVKRNNGPWTFQSTNSAIAAWDVVIDAAGKILLGGTVWTFADSATFTRLDSLAHALWPKDGNGEDAEPYPTPANIFVDDFLLIRLTSDGAVDESFNGTGFAQLPHIYKTGSLPFDTEVPFEQDASKSFAVAEPYLTRSLTGIAHIVLDGDKIIVGGPVRRLATVVSDGLETPLGPLGLDIGFGLVRYEDDGTIDSDFGTSGKTFTGSQAFYGHDYGISSMASLEILKTGTTKHILAVGRGNHAGDTLDVLFAQYSYDGIPDVAYNSTSGNGTRVSTDDRLKTIIPVEGGNNSPFFSENPRGGPFGFDPTDGKIVVAIPKSPNPHDYKLYRLDPVSGDVIQTIAPPAPALAGEIGQFRNERLWFNSTFDLHTIFVSPNEILYSGAITAGNNARLVSAAFVLRYHDFAGTTNGAGATFVPMAVDRLEAVGNVHGAVSLTWTNTGFGQEGFEIWRSATSDIDAHHDLIGAVGPYQNDFIDAPDGTSHVVSPDKTYYYKVVPFASNGSGIKVLAVAAEMPMAAVHTFPAAAPIGPDYVLAQTLWVPADGTSTSSGFTLDSDSTYLLVASGSLDISSDAEHTSRADAGYWYVSTNPKLYGESVAGVRYGLGITDGTQASSVILWGAYDPASHRYTYALKGTGHPVTFSFHGSALLADMASPLKVEIYGDATLTTPISGSSVREITSQVAGAGDPEPLINVVTPVDVLSADPSGSNAPWALWLTSTKAPGTPTLLTSSDLSIGALPSRGTRAFLLDPALYPNGQYALELTSSARYGTGPVFSKRLITIQTVVKAGALTLPITDATFSTPAGPVQITRVYDSSRLSEAGYFGPGWTLGLLDTQLHTTARADTYNPFYSAQQDLGLGHVITAQEASMLSPVLRAGDLVYLTVPEDGPHAFAFAPVPIVESSINPASMEYYPRFVALDGSGATLSIPRLGDDDFPHGQPSDISLRYDPASNEFLVDGSNYPAEHFDLVGFNPARPNSGGKYLLTTKTGTSYLIDAITGQIKQSFHDNGAVTTFQESASHDKIEITYKSNPSAGATTLATIYRDSDGRVTSIVSPGRQTLKYYYSDVDTAEESSAERLTTVQDQMGNSTFYGYGDGARLSSITNAQGLTVLQANYDENSRQLESLVNAKGVTIPIAFANGGGRQVIQTISDPTGNVTEYIFDEIYGNLLRKIQAVDDDAGNLHHYLVTVMNYSYVLDDVATSSDLRQSGTVLLQNVRQYPTFEILGTDIQEIRYSSIPSGNSWITSTTFDTGDRWDDAARGQVIQISQRIGDDGTLQTTTFGNYRASGYWSSADSFPVTKPQNTTVTIQTPGGSSGYVSHVQSAQYIRYRTPNVNFQIADDDLRQLSYSLQSLGVADPARSGRTLAQGTKYLYSSDVNTPDLLIGTESVVVSVDAGGNFSADDVKVIGGALTPTSGGSPARHYNTFNAYYDHDDIVTNLVGSLFGALKYTVDAAGQETFYAYDDAGHAVLNYVYKSWNNSVGDVVNGWVGTTSVYDQKGRIIEQYQGVYRAGSNQSDVNGYHLMKVKAGGPGGMEPDETPYVDDVVNQNVDHFIDFGAVRTMRNDYNEAGQLSASMDQFNSETLYTYDASGRAIRTQYLGGTETRAVYDDLGRIVWQSNRYAPSSTPVHTHTLYNSLGQVVEVDQVVGGSITIASGLSGSAAVSTSTMNISGSTVQSTSKKWYDEQGRVIEILDGYGLRTGMVYAPNGQVIYQGILKNTAPDGGRAVTTNGMTHIAFDFAGSADFDSLTTHTTQNYDGTRGLFYDHSLDANSHGPMTIHDALGRTVRVQYPEETGFSFSETLYSVGDTEVSNDQESVDLTPDRPSANEGWHGIPAGGQEVVSIAQRKSGEDGVITYRLYDAAGRLTDVWLPAVVDGATTSTGKVHPHTHYTYDTAGNQLTQEIHTAADELTQPNTHTHTSRHQYDPLGNQIKEVLPGGEVASAHYNSLGQLLYQQDFNHQYVAYYYDSNPAARGRLQAKYYFASDVFPLTENNYIITSPAEAMTSYTYDALDRVKQVQEWNVVDTTLNRTTAYTYDPVCGQVQSVASLEGYIHYAYDNQGVLRETYTKADDHSTTPINTFTSYGYDIQGRLQTITVSRLNGSPLTTNLETHYTYDAVGNKLSETLPNGLVTTYAYDLQNRLKAVLVSKPIAGGYPQELFAQQYTLNSNGTRASVHEFQLQEDGTTTRLSDTAWTYDAVNRLIGEEYSTSTYDIPTQEDNDDAWGYTETFTYDLASNRKKKIHGEAGTTVETVTYSYNSNDELLSETSSITANSVSYSYDANGNQTASTQGSTVNHFHYNLKNKLDAVTMSGVVTSYTYDDQGHRVSEATGGVKKIYLNDDNNPTGYSQPVEEKKVLGNLSTLSLTYLVGDYVYGQITGGNAPVLSYLETDGHGSTRQLTDTSGNVTEAYRYKAWGEALGFDPNIAGTVLLFGGDAIYDVPTGFRLAGNGRRPVNDFHFVQGGPEFLVPAREDPRSLHAYLYADANPISNSDPTGQFTLPDILSAAVISAGITAEAGGYIAAIYGIAKFVVAGIKYFDASLGLMVTDPGDYKSEAYFYGRQADALEEMVTSSIFIAGGFFGIWAGQLIRGMGVAMLATSGGAATTAATQSCFLAGTDVLLGDGQTEEAIDQIHVGQRVATDGGAANSADGHTAAEDPNATEVDAVTWRLVIIKAGDWEVQALEPLSWIVAHNANAGSWLRLSDIVDLAEMGASDDLWGQIEAVEACPNIEAGPGRVVLTTVSHLNNYVFDLTLTDASGHGDALGVTGYHRFYTEDRGWVTADQLYLGELIRGEHGDVTVTSLARDAGVFRVYNMTVEADHVFYVGDVDALVHNQCAVELHHLLPKQFVEFFQRVGLDIEKFKIPLSTDLHRLLPDGIHTGPYAQSWNGVWETFKNQFPNATAGEILEQLARMRQAFGI